MTARRALVGLVACGAPHAQPNPAGPPDVRCELAVVRQRPIVARVTVRNHSTGRIWLGQQLDTLDADWIVDGRDGAAREQAASAAIQPPVEVSFSGPTGDPVPRDRQIALAPQAAHSWTLDVVNSAAGSQRVVNGVDLSPMTLLAAALGPAGSHTLGLVVRSYPTDQRVQDEVALPWEARCNTIQIEVNP